MKRIGFVLAWGIACSTAAQDHGVRIYQQVSGAVAWVESIAPDSITRLRGSGVVLKRQRLLVTNFHVWKNGGVLSARLGDVPLRLGNVLCADREKDVVVVDVLGTTPPEAWDRVPQLEHLRSDSLVPGMDAYAVGNPRGVELTISYGLVSGVRPNLNDTAKKLIQFSAPISEGNSGGALVDGRGRLIGIPTVWFSDGGGQALNFAIPMERVAQAAMDERNDLPPPDAWWLSIWRAYRTKDCAQVGKLFSAMPKDSPHGLNGGYLLARCYQIGGQLNDAKGLFETLVTKDPLDTKSLYRLGEILHAQGDIAGGFEQKARAIRLNPDLAHSEPAY